MLGEIYEKHYKKLMLFPFAMLLFFSSVLLGNYLNKGYILERDISLKGGTAISFRSDQSFDLGELRTLSAQLFGTDDVLVRELRDVSGNLLGYEVEVGKELNATEAVNSLSEALGVDASQVSVSRQSSTVASSFYKDVLRAFPFAFVLMSLVIYYYFRSFIPAFSILFSTLSDVVCILGTMALLGMRMSAATLGALLMVIGYSTDSDILLAVNILKRREGRLMDRIRHAIKTELTMDAAAFTTYFLMYFLSNVGVVKHIAFILMISILFDIINTWVQNAGFQRMYLERRGR
ncbi:MAG TPA: hypothetical protein ENF51_01080 [Candidatus Aenigmarchaeota archaeon]|nr:hypothetical protein [Candidatus Aenigmarchaeota archaeon]